MLFSTLQRDRKLPSSGGLFVALAVVGLLFPPTVNPCPVKAGLTKARGASCCAAKVAAEQAPVRSCCARKAGGKPTVASKTSSCGVQTSCCCKARPAPGQAVVVLITRPASEPIAWFACGTRLPVESTDSNFDRLPTTVIPDSPAHLNRLLCTWQI